MFTFMNSINVNKLCREIKGGFAHLVSPLISVM